MPSMFTKTLDLKLLKLVKDNPIIYNTKHANYLDYNSREVVWQKIGDVLNRPAVQFAGIQCQIHFDDFQEEKHKPGFLENLNEYLPEQYSGSWGIEKKILKDYKKHQGIGHLEAKHLYTKTARALPTYGVTFYLVKEKEKTKNKLVHCLLGINYDAILRLDMVTKEILQQWPLTHVKTYHAKNSAFTLNFGDYSDEDYCVKTQDSYRIRDTLEAYIDLIRKRLLAKGSAFTSEHMAICDDHVGTSKGDVIQHVSHNAFKIVEQSFVGPSKIIPYEQGKEASQSTQFTTVQQIIVTGKCKNQQHAMKGEVPMRGDMTMSFTRKLNRLNSSSVQIVTLLADPSDSNIAEAQKIVAAMEADMPLILNGVKETAEKQTDEEEKRKLLDQLKQLSDLIRNLSSCTRPGNVNPSEAEEVARGIADLTTQMYFAMDPKTKRRSDMIRRSRKSFIEDERTDAVLRHASFIAASTTALHVIDVGQENIHRAYEGPPLDGKQLEVLEKAAVDKIGKLNAAVGLFLIAHSDPKNIDYPAAINSMNMIKDLMPELVKDSQALASNKDGMAGKELLGDVSALCDTIKKVCTLTGADNHEKMQEAAVKYADVARKLLFKLGHGSNVEKENEIKALAKVVGEQTTLVLLDAKEVEGLPEQPEGAALAAAATDLLTTTQLTAPAIGEPHCRSALSAAAEALAGAAAALARRARPPLGGPARHQLHAHAMDLAKALDNLKNSYAHLAGNDDQDTPQRQRLNFITTVSGAKKNLQAAEDQLTKPVTGPPLQSAQATDLRNQLAQRLAQLNAAIASLVSSTADRENPNYGAADRAVKTISELMPQVVQDTKTVSAGMEDGTRAAMLDHIKALCEASRGICASAEGVGAEGLHDSVAKFADASGKLVYVVGPLVNTFKEQEILDLSAGACDKTSELLSHVQQLASAVGGEQGEELDRRGAHTADAAQALLTAAQVTASSISDGGCESALVSSVDALSRSVQQLLRHAPVPQAQALEQQAKQLEALLDKLRNACHAQDDTCKERGSAPQERQRLQFVSTVSGAKRDLQAAERELGKPAVPLSGDPAATATRLAQRVARLNAAVARLLAATADREKPDYAAAEQAIKAITELMPQVVKDTKTLSVGKDDATRAAMLNDIRQLCDASRGIYATLEGANPEDLNEAVAKFAEASGKLVYVVSPSPDAQKEQEILDLSAGACAKTSELLARVQQLASAVGGRQGEELDRRGAHTADAAQALLATAQVTASSISDAECQSALVSSADALSKSAQLLLRHAPGPETQALQQQVQQLEALLDKLKKACHTEDDSCKERGSAAQERQRLQFVSTVSGAKRDLQAAERELGKPAVPLSGDPAATATRLAQRVARLNAAVARLLAATADREKPDYAAAEQAIKAITELMPQVVKDTKTLSVGKDDATRAAMLNDIRQLCDASRGIYATLEGANPEDLNEAVAKFAEASGKLVYVVSPSPDAQKEQEILDLSAGACAKTSELLARVQQLASAVGGRQGEELHRRGAHTADAAQALLATAQVTASSIADAECQSALVSSADALSKSAQQLLRHAPGPETQALQQQVQQLEALLDKLKTACHTEDDSCKERGSAPQERQRLQFVSTVSGAKRDLQAAERELEKPAVPLSGDPAATATRLAQRLARLNAAVARLLAATADREKPDYAAAEKAIKAIAELMPQVVKDTKTLSVGKDDATRAAMLNDIRQLCDASRGIYATLEGANPEDLNEAVAKFAEASGKLVYVVSPSPDAQKEQEILDLSAGACAKTSELLARVQQLASAVGGRQGEELDRRGAHTADAAQALLATAQVTASSISDAECQSALVSSADALSKSAQQLLRHAPGPETQALQQQVQQLEALLDKLKKACHTEDDSCKERRSAPQERQRLQFVSTVSGAKRDLQAAERELDKPALPLSGDPAATATRLAQRVARLNAAVARLLAATADREKPDYAAAEQAIKAIAELMPQVVKDSKAVSVGKDSASSSAMLNDIKTLCDASHGLYASTECANPEVLNEAVAKFAAVSGKLVHVVSPSANAKKEQELVRLSADACNKASEMVFRVHQESVQVKGPRGEELERRGARAARDAQALLATAQVTAPSISVPECQSALLTSVAALSTSAQQLAGSSPHQQPLQHDLQQLEALLDKIRRSCQGKDNDVCALKKPPPPVPNRGKAGPEPRTIAHASPSNRSSIIAQDFLDHLRQEESIVHAPALKTAVEEKAASQKEEEENLMQQQFVESVDNAEQSIHHSEESLKQLCKPGAVAAGPPLSASEMAIVQQHLQKSLALAGVQLASLVAANYADKIDYRAASDSIKALPELMSSIVKDGGSLCNSVDDQAREKILENMLQLCDASRNICDAAKKDRQKLNDAAIEFGDNSTKLLYVISTDVAPSLEKEIISRAKAIGDSASRLALEAVNVAAAGPADGSAGVEVAREAGVVESICGAGTRCVDAAGKLVYTAKLVAPSIHESTCQNTLVASADNLSSHLKTFSDSWKPLTSDQQEARSIQDLAKEAQNLERILEGLRSDVRGHMGKKRMEMMIIEDTPLRQLTLKILEGATKSAECMDKDTQKREYASYCNKLSAALRALDKANAMCKRYPHDINKRMELENAIQDLQVTLLQSRPKKSDKESGNVVDLREFIEEVSTEADKLAEAASDVHIPLAQDKKAIEDMKAKCTKINVEAFKLMHSDDTGVDTTFGDILEVDQFGQDCDVLIQEIDDALRSIGDAKAKKLLREKLLPLTESCNMLRFATKSGVATSNGVALDETLNDLEDLESRVIKSLVHDDGVKNSSTSKEKPPAGAAGAARAAALCGAAGAARAAALCGAAGAARAAALCGAAGEAARGRPQRAQPALAGYVADAAARADLSDPHEMNKLLKHLYKLSHLLKTLTVTTSKRLATWQTLDDPEVATITEKILQEIEEPESKYGVSQVKSALNVADVSRLLMPRGMMITGDKKHKEEKLEQLSTKLNVMCGTLMLSVEKPESLARSIHAGADVAVELAATARALKQNHDPVQGELIEQAAQEMSFSTYSLLKTANSVSQNPDNVDQKRTLLDACRILNNAINKLVRTASSAGKMQQACGELSRGLMLQQSALQSAPRATCALPYTDCYQELQNQQDVIHKLKSDQPMSREEFIKELDSISSAVFISTEHAAQCAYLMTISEKDKDMAQEGLVDTPKLQKIIGSVQDSCVGFIRAGNLEQVKEEKDDFQKKVEDLSRALDDGQVKVKDANVKAKLAQSKASVNSAADALCSAVNQCKALEEVSRHAMDVLRATYAASAAGAEARAGAGAAGAAGAGAGARAAGAGAGAGARAGTGASCEDIIGDSRSLISTTQALIKEVKSSPEEPETMTWVTYNTNRRKLMEAYEALLKNIKMHGRRAGLLETAPEEEEVPDAPSKSYVQTQVELANKWLQKPMCKPDVKAAGDQAAVTVIDIARKMAEDLKGNDREELRHVITETEQLLADCRKKYDQEKYSLLSDRLRELKKAVERGVVTRVVEDFMEAELPLADLDIFADAERDETKRKFLLERKIAELLAQLGRVTRTARFVARAGSGGVGLSGELNKCSEQTELLAPILVHAAQQRINAPNDKAIIQNYTSLLARYTESLSKVRDLCDRAVEPMEFVQTASDTMQRMREESSSDNDPQKCAYTSRSILKLAERVMEVSMSSPAVRGNPELQRALHDAQLRLRAARPPPDTRASKLPDWKESTAEILRTTGEVESALGGENIFKKEPQPNQPIYTVAHDLHLAIRNWSSRDNEIVAVAKRMAVLMARLSDYMNTDKKYALIATSKSIVTESHEVAHLAKKLAHECTDLRIKTNLLQACERIPTISGQLKMLTTVKGSSLGHQGTEEDKEAMDMLVGNAQSLMQSIQEVVKAAASASVKIGSQRGGPRIRWVRRNYY